MKKISIIVPVYNVEKYLKRCLSSLVNQTLDDIEIIIVNDGSTDNSQTIIDEYKEKYPNIIKAYKIENGGVAQARNYALNYVEGEYIGFADSDDYISSEMYEKLYSKAKSANAEIVCCNYYRVLDDEKFKKKQFGNKNISVEDNFEKSIYDANLLFDEVPYLWNKIFKSELIKNNNIKFSKDLRIYEDMLFTYQAFSKANKISNVNEALYYYRVSRQESLTYTLTEKRFDLFKVTKMLIAYYKEIGKYEEIKESVLYAVLKHIYVVLEKKTKKEEKKIKREYLKYSFEFLNKEFPSWKSNMYFKLQEKPKKMYTSKFYWKMCILLGGNIHSIQKKINKIIAKLFQIIFTKRVGKKYINQCKKDINEKSIFIFSQQGNNLSGNMFYILKELAINESYKDFNIYVGYSNGSKKKFVKLLENYNILNNVKLIKNETNKFAKLCAKSKYIFTDTSMPVYFIKRKEQVYLNTWHGTPLKTLGKSTENDFFDIANVQKNFAIADYLLYPNEYMKNIMIRDYMLKGLAKNKIMLCGYPRNEIFLRDDFKNAREKLKIDNKTIIAYMPTWRGTVRNYDIESQLIIAQKHIEEISKNLKENQILYVNMHPYIGNKLDLSKYSNVKTFPSNLETYDFLSLCDILITDYSSVFFDFAITNRKIILFAYDEEEYFKERGVYLPFSELPFKKVKTVEELIKEINNPIEYDSKKFIEQYCKYDRNNISKLICEKMILNKENEITIEDMPSLDKENVLLYLDNLKLNNDTQDFIKVVNNTEQNEYNYCFSYITRKLRPNSDMLKKIMSKINFYGQLGEDSNLSRIDIVLAKLLIRNKKIYKIFKKKLTKANKLELKRIFGDVKFKAVILYGKVEIKKIYEMSELDAKKILYIKDKKSFNKRVSSIVYRNFDYILTTNKESYDEIKAYCGQANNIKIINAIENLNDFNEFIK